MSGSTKIGQWQWGWGLLILTFAALAWFAWNCAFNPRTRFLPPGPGEWIVYPLPPALEAYTGIPLTGTFRRSFVLTQKPATASVSWRCFTNGELRVNGLAMGHSSGNWKTTSQLDIAPALHSGANEISVVAVNQLGPPAVALKLQAGDFSLTSDDSWDVSLSGSNWRSAQSAAIVPPPKKGNELDLMETTAGAFQRRWPWLLVFASAAVCGTALWRRFPKWTPVLLAAAWLLLFLHNLPLVPAACGFDAPDHLAYVSYIQEHHQLPDARQGWEMFQPPLYYIISARLLDLCRCAALDRTGPIVLRVLGLGIGVLTVVLVWAGLRLIFPGDRRKPMAGAVLAAFLPAQICLMHYPTNETLAAMFVTGALGLGLYLLRVDRPRWVWSGILGITLGLAFLSKASAILAVAAILAALAAKLALRRERAASVWLTAIGTSLLLCLLIAGWHYAKLWREFGRPFIGSWDPRLIGAWWQMKGYQTPACYFGLGHFMTHPFYSALHGFWDALYTTLWGDGLMGGKVNVWGRPPWNYDLMAMGFILALVPVMIVLTGFVRALAGRLGPDVLPWMLLVGLVWLFGFALLDLSLKFPYYAHTKAFFALPVLLPFCAFGAMGYEFWCARGRWVRALVHVALGIWLADVYASFWIVPGTARTELASAIAASLYLKASPADAFGRVLQDYPGNAQASTWLAADEARTNPKSAVQRLEPVLKSHPSDAAVEAELAWDLGLCGRLDEGVAHAKHALEVSPESKIAAQMWRALAMRRQNYAEAIEAARAALSLDPTDLQTHFDLGVALMNTGRGAEAVNHFSAILEGKPSWAEARFCLGLCLAGQPGTRAEGLHQMKEAIRQQPTNAAWQTRLQQAINAR